MKNEEQVEQREKMELILRVRSDPKEWFYNFARVMDENTRAPIQPAPRKLQVRMFNHALRCWQKDIPCRMIVPKCRRGGGSSAATGLLYFFANNLNIRGGIIGTNYNSSRNLMQMVRFFGHHDTFPGWCVNGRPPTLATHVEKVAMTREEWDTEDPEFESMSFETRMQKMLTTRLEWPHGSTVELYTAQNPESARSAGLQFVVATEVGRWPRGGVKDGAETLNAMIKTLPKTGFSLCVLESTAAGPVGAFADIFSSARWPEDVEWWRQWQSYCPQNLPKTQAERDLQFVRIFSSWYESEAHAARHVPKEDVEFIQSTITEREKEILRSFGNVGPQGERIGYSVRSAASIAQLAWRRAVISQECKKAGEAEFEQEYPSDPQSAFAGSGRMVFDREGLQSLRELSAERRPEVGLIEERDGGEHRFRVSERDGRIHLWERPIEGCRYIIAADCKGALAEAQGSANRGLEDTDRNAGLLLRDTYTDANGRLHNMAVVGRVIQNRWDADIFAAELHKLANLFGGCPIAVETQYGLSVIMFLKSLGAVLYKREFRDRIVRKNVQRYGWLNTDATRRAAISELVVKVREQQIDIWCPGIIAQMQAFVDENGRAEAGGQEKDDDVLAACIAVNTAHKAKSY